MPFIWVTWLTKLMSGENQCWWASWFRSHYSFNKLPSGFDLAKWTMEHNELLHRRKGELESEGFTVFIEEQNSFKLVGKSGITLSGKPDIIAINDGEGTVEDCKTGNPKHSDQVQVLIYLLALPLANGRYKGLKLEGRLIYKNSSVDVHSSEIDGIREKFSKVVGTVGGTEPASKVPSLGECRFCDISKVDCPERIETKIENVVMTNLF